MAPFEALYGEPCRSPSSLGVSAEDVVTVGPETVVDHTEKVRRSVQRLKSAQERQKKYYDQYHDELQYDVGDYVYLKVSPLKGHKRFGIKGKLAPRFIGPFKIVKRVGKIAYRLELPPALVGVHPVFHISMLRLDKSGGGRRPTVDLSQIELQDDATYEEQPIQIVDRKVKILRNKEIPSVLVKWQFHGDEELTWELESYMREHFPYLFDSWIVTRHAILRTVFRTLGVDTEVTET
ncbi:hypothetical protein Scep_025533 [Stephania cephalantha]|uniref:Tf2-1-like SH3-like domain-containing protein n=1 Tax=Stephania cephalantha TaxID=152367 RepID=A0AAP0HPF9_9MAGN